MASTPDTPTARTETSAVEIATTVSPEVRIAAAQAVLSENPVEVTKLLRDRLSETLATVEKLLASAGYKARFSLPEAGNAEGVIDVEFAELSEERELSPEAAERMVNTLESRFKANNHLHEGCDWSRVKSALEANPEALWSVSQMETKGHLPNVYHFDDNGFDIGTCSEETPTSGRNCVYDAKAAAWLKENYPNETFNGTAVEMAEEMGIELMSEAQYKDVLQQKGKFDRDTWSWLKTDAETRKAGCALIGDRHGVRVYVKPYDARNRNDHGAWRGSLRVSWA